MNGPIIEARNISKVFRIGTRERLTLFSALRYKLSGEYPTREFWALRDISFSVQRGEMVAIIGPNGAGKTTLLRILSGIMAPTSGSFAVREDVSCIFELGLGFNPRFTAIENVYLYGALHGISRREIEKKLPDIIEFSELEGFMGARLSEYSSGMKARLAFATVIQTVKGIVMIDEVLAVGDAAFQKKCLKAIEQVKAAGNTILFIAHGIAEARSLCTRALYIDGGTQVAYGPVPEVEEMYEKAQHYKEKYGRPSAPILPSPGLTKDRSLGTAQGGKETRFSMEHGGKTGFIREFAQFFWERKLWWFVPMVIVLLILGALIFFAQSSAVAPFVYVLF